MTPDDPVLAGALRACAHGIYPDEAGVELLIAHATFLRRLDFRERFIDVDSNITNGTQYATINWADAISALNAGHLCCSSGEESILRLAASLTDGSPVSLRDTVTGLDHNNTQIVIKAIFHATGHRSSTKLHDHS